MVCTRPKRDGRGGFSESFGCGPTKTLAGIVETFGNFRRTDAVGIYDAALAEDFSRPAAEDAFRKLGPVIVSHLICLAASCVPTAESESESSKRRRRSALKLLTENSDAIEPKDNLKALTYDSDPRVCVLACSICLPKANLEEKQRMITRLTTIERESDNNVGPEAMALVGNTKGANAIS